MSNNTIKQSEHKNEEKPTHYALVAVLFSLLTLTSLFANQSNEPLEQNPDDTTLKDTTQPPKVNPCIKTNPDKTLTAEDCDSPSL